MQLILNKLYIKSYIFFYIWKQGYKRPKILENLHLLHLYSKSPNPDILYCKRFQTRQTGSKKARNPRANITSTRNRIKTKSQSLHHAHSPKYFRFQYGKIPKYGHIHPCLHHKTSSIIIWLQHRCYAII